MTNRLRYCAGVTQLCRMPVAADTVIHEGSLVYLDSGTVKPARDFSPAHHPSVAQSRFAVCFAGVAHQWSAAGEAGEISVDISPLAVYEFNCEPFDYGVGTRLGPATVRVEAGSHGPIGNRLARVYDDVRCIARAVEFTHPGATTVRVNFMSSLHVAFDSYED